MKHLIEEAIKKLEEAQEELRTENIKDHQAHYEIGKALSELRYVLSKYE